MKKKSSVKTFSYFFKAVKPIPKQLLSQRSYTKIKEISVEESENSIETEDFSNNESTINIYGK